MPETRERLVGCFQAVFPDLSDSDAARASASGLSQWDSVATVTLAAAVEEEFDLQLPPEQIEKLDSFQAYLKLLDGRA